MKRITALLSLFLAVTVSVPALAAETSATTEDCIRNFYHWYVSNLVANRDPLKQRREIRRYASDRLFRQIDKMAKGPDGLDGDYFVDAQDFDPLWAKNISISAVQIHGDKSDARVLLNGARGMQRRLRVHLAKESGNWKVDKVQGAD